MCRQVMCVLMFFVINHHGFYSLSVIFYNDNCCAAQKSALLALYRQKQKESPLESPRDLKVHIDINAEAVYQPFLALKLLKIENYHIEKRTIFKKGKKETKPQIIKRQKNQKMLFSTSRIRTLTVKWNVGFSPQHLDHQAIKPNCW